MFKKSDYLLLLQSCSPSIAFEYMKKVNFIYCDPYTLDESLLNTDSSAVPLISNNDISTYLVSKHSFYTNDQMIAYDDEDFYKYIKDGCVQYLGSKQISNCVLALVKVNELNEASEPFHVWIIVNLDGSISAAHCTCMSNVSNVCVHIAAALFAIGKENLISTDDNTIVSEPILSNENIDLHDSTVPNSNAPTLKRSEIVSFLQKFENINYTTNLARIVPPLCHTIAKKYSNELDEYNLLN